MTNSGAQRRHRWDAATAEMPPPLAAVDMDALQANAAMLRRRAAGKPIRIASKSVRCRDLITSVLAMPGFSGVLAYTLPEALWLVRHGIDDVMLGYPTTDESALRDLAASPELAQRITLQADSVAHLDLLQRHAGAQTPLRVCLDLDAALQLPGGRLRAGVHRSRVHSPRQAEQLAAEVLRREGLRLVGLMSYEAQLAGVPDRVPGAPLRTALVAGMKLASAIDLRRRRSAQVRRVMRLLDRHGLPPLEIVNAGGSGSLEHCAADPLLTEVTAGSGLLGPALFDHYRRWRPQPAAAFALPVVRRPGPHTVTVLGGGWIASGKPGTDRLPQPWMPEGLRLDSTESAGEVQTPLHGPAAGQLQLGDRVWFRHAKSGELLEHVTDVHLLRGSGTQGTVPSYRGEGTAFL